MIYLAIIYFLSVLIVGIDLWKSNAYMIRNDRDYFSKECPRYGGKLRYGVTYLDVLVDIFATLAPIYNTFKVICMVFSWLDRHLNKPIIKG